MNKINRLCLTRINLVVFGAPEPGWRGGGIKCPSLLIHSRDRWSHMVWKLRLGVQTAAILVPPSYLSLIFSESSKTTKIERKVTKITKTTLKRSKHLQLPQLSYNFSLRQENSNFWNLPEWKYNCHGNITFFEECYVISNYHQISFRKIHKVCWIEAVS